MNRRRRNPKIGVGCSVATASVMITAIRTTLQRQRQTINDQSVSLVARNTCNNRSKVTTSRKLFPAVPPNSGGLSFQSRCALYGHHHRNDDDSLFAYDFLQKRRGRRLFLPTRAFPGIRMKQTHFSCGIISSKINYLLPGFTEQ